MVTAVTSPSFPVAADHRSTSLAASFIRLRSLFSAGIHSRFFPRRAPATLPTTVLRWPPPSSVARRRRTPLPPPPSPTTTSQSSVDIGDVFPCHRRPPASASKHHQHRRSPLFSSPYTAGLVLRCRASCPHSSFPFSSPPSITVTSSPVSCCPAPSMPRRISDLSILLFGGRSPSPKPLASPPRLLLRCAATSPPSFPLMAPPSTRPCLPSLLLSVFSHQRRRPCSLFLRRRRPSFPPATKTPSPIAHSKHPLPMFSVDQ